jgi:hypothetical protein
VFILPVPIVMVLNPQELAAEIQGQYATKAKHFKNKIE